MFQIVASFLIVSQGSVATRLRFAGIVNASFIANLLISLSAADRTVCDRDLY